MEILQAYSEKLTKAIQSISTLGFTEESSFEFNTSDLLEYQDRTTSTKCGVWDSFWKSYNLIFQPVVYWFEIVSDIKRQEIMAAVVAYKDQNARSVPAIKINFANWDTNTLYVGSCSKTRLRDRIHQHLGYYVEGRTQGLQLCHWARPLNIDLRLHVILLPVEASDLTVLYEKELALNKKPLIGKHR